MSTQLATIFEINRQFVGRGGRRFSGDFGVEIETETKKKYEFPVLKSWNCVKDGSLRDYGVEYVLKEPMSIPELEQALQEFAVCEKKYGFIKDSISTSVHVHVNMQNMTYLHMANFITLYSIFENVLIRYSGPDRLSNLFCLPMCDAEGVKDQLVSMLQTIQKQQWTKVRPNNDKVKYGAINPAPIATLQTLEVRSFRGETDATKIQKWVEIINKIKQYALQPKLTPPDILLLWKQARAGFLEMVFQEHAQDLHYRDPNTKKDITADLIKQNLEYAAQLASVTKDWESFGVVKLKPVYKEKLRPELEAISNERFGVPFDSLPYHERLVVYEKYERANPKVKIVDADDDL